jgi:hypothetical protein
LGRDSNPGGLLDAGTPATFELLSLGFNQFRPVGVGLLEVRGLVLGELALDVLVVLQEEPAIHDLPSVDLDREQLVDRDAVGAVAAVSRQILFRVLREGRFVFLALNM